jgi:hypothetical protein
MDLFLRTTGHEFNRPDVVWPYIKIWKREEAVLAFLSGI